MSREFRHPSPTRDKSRMELRWEFVVVSLQTPKKDFAVTSALNTSIVLLRLSLARASGGAIGLSSSGGSTVAVSVGSDGGLDVQRVGKRSLGHATERLAGGALAALLVGSKVERNEENQIRAENRNTRESGKFLASALAGVGHPGEVGRGEVSVRGEVDEA